MTTPHLDITTCPLQGTTLIEASAGTGKTYTIAALFLRLLVEKNMPVNEILVVTFTRAATQELRQRLYATLLQAKACFQEKSSGEPHIERLRDLPELPLPVKMKRVEQAIRDFDEAAISTIHSFCQRMLQEHAFASAALADIEVTSNQAGLIMAALEDFWRHHITCAPLEVMAEITRTGLSGFFELFQYQERNPELVLRGGEHSPSPADLQAAAKRWQAAGTTFSALLPDSVDEIVATMQLERKLLKGVQKKWLVSAAEKMLTWRRGRQEGFTSDEKKGFAWFSEERIAAKARTDERPQHPLFAAVSELLAAHDNFQRLKDHFLAALQRKMFTFVNDQLARNKEELAIHAFNDFLVAMAGQLARQSDENPLATAVRRRFKAALIDEFQDTDPLQYTIFSTLFQGGKSTLFLIGDPKQAIYSFRGADIFAYLKAARHVDRRLTLPVNYRSDAALVAAVNTLFSPPVCHDPFAEKEITFQPVEAARKTSSLLIDGKEAAGLRIWAPSQEQSQEAKLTAGKLLPLLGQAVSTEISRLLTLADQGRATLPDDKGNPRPLRPGDFAILTRSKKQMQLMAHALARAGIPAVQSSSHSIFTTAEAHIMELLLASLAEPDSTARLKAMLAQPLFAMPASEMWRHEEEGWAAWRGVMRDYSEIFHRRGFLVFFRQLLADQQIKARLLSQHLGERSLVNLLQLAEILHIQQQQASLSPAILQNWLANQIQDELQRTEEYEQRMESDENGVQIVTIHKSKGLEYPIVFAPFLWKDSSPRTPLCHVNEKITLFLDQEEYTPFTPQAGQELLAENLRILYVALTRARHLCYTLWTKLSHHSKPATSAPAHLFHGGNTAAGFDESQQKVKKRYDEIEDVDGMRVYLHDLFQHQPHISVTPLPDPEALVWQGKKPDPSALTCRPLPALSRESRQISSFSSISRHSAHQPGPLAATLTVSPMTAPATPEPAPSIHTFPRGARPGTFLHELLENLDFQTMGSEESRRAIATALHQHRFEAHFCQPIHDMFCRLVNQPLDDFHLAQVSARQRLNEMEFYFPLARISPADLQQLFGRQHGVAEPFHRQSKRLDFSPCQGYMHGFIDLVFRHDDRYYLVDWKSNYLGPDSGSYQQENLLQAMAEHDYYLQYHLYTLALHLHLGASLPDYDYERHFGGIYYLFLRGIDPARPGKRGVFAARPQQEMVTEMTRLLCREKNHA